MPYVLFTGATPAYSFSTCLSMVIANNLPQLPIHPVLTEITAALAKTHAVLSAPPGSGKTTIVPLDLLDAPWLEGKKILILEPRRLATRAAATRMASLLGEEVGQTVGYQIRFDRKVCQSTKIEVVTEGILTRRIQEDSELSDVGLIIFDEFHERSIHADLALALCLDLCQLREDLRLLIMSATLDTQPIAHLLGDAPIIVGKGYSHEVQIEYSRSSTGGRVTDRVVSGVNKVLAEQTGDILVFLPGVGEIKAVQKLLEEQVDLQNCIVTPLHGSLPQFQQDKAIAPDPKRRKVILATSIAETSLTIENVSAVVDSGLSRKPQFYPGNGLTRLVTVKASKAVTEQRAGRAGRLGPGYCLRLWSQEAHHSLLAFHPPEIATADLAPLVLELARWGVTDPLELSWLETPKQGAFNQARALLQSLGAVSEQGKITATGKEMAALGVHPRLGYMLIKGKELGQVPLACDLAALLSERDILIGKPGEVVTDLHSRLQLLSAYRRSKLDGFQKKRLHIGAVQRVKKSSALWQRQLNGNNAPRDINMAGPLLSFAYPDRIAQQRQTSTTTYLMASGRAATLQPHDPLSTSEYLIIAHLDAGQKQGRIYLAEPLTIDEIKQFHDSNLRSAAVVEWNESARRVTAVTRTHLGALTLKERPLDTPPAAQVMEAMLAGIKNMTIDKLPWSKEAQQFQARAAFGYINRPDLGWPDLRYDSLTKELSWLLPYLQGISRADQLSSLSLHQILTNMLSWEQQQQLNQLVPPTIKVPSGSNIKITYAETDPPALRVRIQEVFGWQCTPTVLNGTVQLVLHLLSPAMRPVQVTTDLAGFWERSYPEIKKELKGRYPKHFWPDDPLTAAPTHRAKPRGTKK